MDMNIGKEKEKKTDKNLEKVKPVEITDLYSLFLYLRNTLKVINDSKIFAGLMIITLNIASRFVNLKLSKMRCLKLCEFRCRKLFA